MLRRKGVQIRQRDLGSAVTLIGSLTLSSTKYGDEWIQALHLQHPQSVNSSGHLASLMKPELLNLGALGMRFRGLESVETAEGKAGVVQEWLVDIL